MCDNQNYVNKYASWEGQVSALLGDLLPNNPLKSSKKEMVSLEAPPPLLFSQRPQLGLGQAGPLIGGVPFASPPPVWRGLWGGVTVWPLKAGPPSRTPGWCPSVTSDCLREGIPMT